MAITRRQFVTRWAHWLPPGHQPGRGLEAHRGVRWQRRRDLRRHVRQAEGHLDPRCGVHRLFDVAAGPLRGRAAASRSYDAMHVRHHHVGTRCGLPASCDSATAPLGGTAPSAVTLTPRSRFNADRRRTTLNIADVLIDFIDLQYHETVMGMGGDLAPVAPGLPADTDWHRYAVRARGRRRAPGQDQRRRLGRRPATRSVPWCSIGMPTTLRGASTTCSRRRRDLAIKADCVAIVPIGQCAYLRRLSRLQAARSARRCGAGGFDPDQSRPAPRASTTSCRPRRRHACGGRRQGHQRPGLPDEPVVVRSDRCPWLVDRLQAVGRGTAHRIAIGAGRHGRPSIKPPSIARFTRPQLVLPALPRYATPRASIASKPGEAGCLQNIGCKGLVDQLALRRARLEQPAAAEQPASLGRALVNAATATAAATASRPGIPAWPAPRRATRTLRPVRGR